MRPLVLAWREGRRRAERRAEWWADYLIRRWAWKINVKIGQLEERLRRERLT